MRGQAAQFPGREVRHNHDPAAQEVLGRVVLGDPRDDLAALETQVDRTVYLKGDQNAPYGAIMRMMDALREAGIETVALITEPPAEGVSSEGGV